MILTKEETQKIEEFEARYGSNCDEQTMKHFEVECNYCAYTPVKLQIEDREMMFYCPNCGVKEVF